MTRRALLDTHVLLWAWVSPEKLSNRVRAFLEDPGNERLVSGITAYEISNKFRIGRLDVDPDLVKHYTAHLRRFRAQEVSVNSQHALLASSFASPHRDPFDRLLAAQSHAEQVPLLTLDSAFKDFPIQAIW